MDDTITLSTRSAAMEALSNLSSSHARMTNLATALVDRLFPGDGLTRDETILPFANLAFIAVTKARADLDTYAKSFSEVLKTIDTMRGTTSGSAPEAGSSASPSSTSDSIVQSESGTSSSLQTKNLLFCEATTANDVAFSFFQTSFLP